jgi:hypothetical protein
MIIVNDELGILQTKAIVISEMFSQNAPGRAEENDESLLQNRL